MYFKWRAYGPNSAGREKIAWNVLNLPALQESPSPNGWSGKLVLLVSWLSMVCEYLTEFSPSWSVRHFWQVLYTLCIVTETSWKISDIGSDNFQMISVIFHMMFGKWQIHVKSFFAHNVFLGPDTKKQKRLRSLELNVLPGARTRFLIAFIFCDLRQKEWFLVN